MDGHGELACLLAWRGNGGGIFFGIAAECSVEAGPGHDHSLADCF